MHLSIFVDGTCLYRALGDCDYGLTVEVCELCDHSEEGPGRELKRHDVVLADAVESIRTHEAQPARSGETYRRRRRQHPDQFST